MTSALDWVQTNVCLSPALTTDADGLLALAPWSVPRLVFDEVVPSGGNGPVYETTTLPGKLMMEKRGEWYNDTPLDHLVIIRVIRGEKSWITSNPNAIEIRDRWTRAIDAEPSLPTVNNLSNGRAGSAMDLGTNSVAEPEPGRQWEWWGPSTADETIGPVSPGSTLKVWYRAYLWTPYPWSNNANNSSPQHSAALRPTRIQMIALPRVEVPEGMYA